MPIEEAKATLLMTTRRQAVNRCGESGQTTIWVVLVLAIFLLAAVGLAIDYGSVFFHRQTAQGAADAACQAGAMDMLVLAQGGTVPAAGFTAGTDFNCAAQPTAVPCRYAAINGYNGTGKLPNTESNEVMVTFPPTVGGVTTPPEEIAGPHPFMKVSVSDRVRMYFSTLLTGNKTHDIGAHAVCGLQEASAPIPIIILHPTCPHAFEVSGSANLTVIGGPTRSVQVNSGNRSTACATAGSSADGQCGTGSFSASCPCASCQVDLCQGGPNFTGSSFGTYGSAGNPSADFSAGSTGSWDSPSTPILDPFASTNPPPEPALSPTNGIGIGNQATPRHVAYRIDGCPDRKNGCDEYYPGKYTNYIKVAGATAIFVPGIYYMTAADTNAGYKGSPSSCSAGAKPNKGDAAVAVTSNGVVRPADCTAAGSCNLVPGTTYPSLGTMFYFTNNSGAMAIVNNAGARAPGFPTCVNPHTASANPDAFDCFDTAVATCPGGLPPDNRLGLPTMVGGNVLLGQCTHDGTYTTAAYSSADKIRGFVVFQDRAISDLAKQSSFQGSGSLLLAGTLYAHSRPSYSDFIQLQGTPGSGTFVLGEIVTDQLVLSGNGSVAMQLNPLSVYHVLKVSLLE